MIRYAFSTRILMIIFFSSIAILSLAFAGGDGDYFRGYPNNNQTTSDTIPGKKQLQRNAMDDESFQNSRVNMKAVEEAMRNVERSMQELKSELGQNYNDYNKIFDKANWQKVQKEYQKALTQLDYNRLNKQIALERQHMISDINRQMELSKLNLEESRKAMQLALQFDVNKQMQKARVQLKGAKKQLDEINNFKEDLQKDELIKQNEPYEIEIKEGDLYINGKKQKNKISRKYKNRYPKFFEKGGQFKLNNDSRKIRKFDMNEENELI